MLKPNRHKSSENYRYGFQGQETDNELKGEGNSINYKYRMHDPRIGRFFAVDPLAADYTFQSPYVFAANNPIAFIEILGLGPGDPIKHTVEKGDNLTKISKKYGISLDDLAEMNNITDINHIEIGQVLDVNPEANFSKNPRGSYRNPNNSYGEEVEVGHIASVGLNFVAGTGKENSIIIGGGALTSIQEWKEVGKLINSAIKEIKSDGKLTPGETATRPFRAGDLPSNIKKGLKEAWHKIKNRENPWENNSQNSPIHVLGSFNLSLRVNADGVSATVAIYDSKTFTSFSDGNASEKTNRNRKNAKYKFLTNTYQRYLWNINLIE